MKIVLLPLDERPCNRIFPGELFSHGDKTEIVVPQELGFKKKAADLDKIHGFLLEETRDADGLVISMDMLLYGGLVPSRIHNMDTDELKGRLEVLPEIKYNNPDITIFGFQCIMRCPNYSLSDEEPDYYDSWGKEIHDFGVYMHKEKLGIAQEFENPQKRIPKEVLEDYTTRRNTNRAMDEMTLALLEEGIIDFLVFPQDDSAKFGFAAMDQHYVRSRIEECCLLDRVIMYPGADEVGLILTSRMINHFEKVEPKVYVKYASELSKTLIPAYEGGTLANTISYHILSAGCSISDSYENADIVLCVTAPGEKMEEAAAQPSRSPGYVAERNLSMLLSVIKKSVSEGKVVTVCDNAYANGGDLVFVKMLNKAELLMRVAGYAGWNTSSNTLGTALAMGVDAFVFGDSSEHRDFLAKRYVEDVGYCSVVRTKVTEMLPEDMNYFDVHEGKGEVSLMVKKELEIFLKEYLYSEDDNIRITDAKMPWNRMFEVDVNVKYDR